MADRSRALTRLLDTIEHEWKAFVESCEGLTAGALTTPGVVGDWTVKDLIAHVTIWEGEALKHLPLIAQGGRPPRYSVAYGGIDAFNDQQIAASRSRELSDVLRGSMETHRQLITYLEDVPPELLASTSRFRRRLRLDTYSHYPIHAEQIRAWRSRRKETGTG